MVIDIVAVGVAPDACDSQPEGLCAVYPAQGPNPLQRAVDIAYENSAIWLHADPSGVTAVYEGRADIPKSLVIEGAPGTSPDQILVKGAGCIDRGVLVLEADNITLRGFKVSVPTRCDHAVRAWMDPVEGWTSGHLIERMILVATAVAYQGSNSTEAAIETGSDTLVRNNFIYGWWEGVVNLEGTQDHPVQNTRVVHNTIVATETKPGALIGFSEDVTLTNNIFVQLNAGSGPAIQSNSSTINALVQGNIAWGYDRVAEPDINPGFNWVENPLLVNMRDPEPAIGSSAIGSALADPEAGEMDLWGQVRPVAGPADVGAVISTGLRNALQDPVRVGTTEFGCPAASLGPCDFFHQAGQSLVLARALQATPPGFTVEFYADALTPATYETTAGGAVVDRPLTLKRADGQPPDSVILFSTGNLYRGIVSVTSADGVIISGLRFQCNVQCRGAVYFDPDPGLHGAHDGLIDRCYVTGGGNYPAFKLGPRGMLRNSLARGNFSMLALAQVDGAQVVGNTFRSTLTAAAVTTVAGFDISNSTDFLAANNLIDLRDVDPLKSRQGAICELGVIGTVLEQNQLYGVDSMLAGCTAFLTPADMPPGTNCAGSLPNAPPPGALCASDDPLYEDASTGNLQLAAGSPAIDEGDDTYVLPEDQDVLDGQRILGISVDVGAYETTP